MAKNENHLLRNHSAFMTTTTYTEAEWPFMQLTEAERFEIYADALRQFEPLVRDRLDFQTVMRMVQSAYAPPEEMERPLKKELHNLYRILIAFRADELEVSEKSVRAWTRRHGLGILNDNDAGDRKLFERIGMHQRVPTESVRQWMNFKRALWESRRQAAAAG